MLRARFERNDSSTFAAKARRLFESGASHRALRVTMGAFAATTGLFALTAPAMANCVREPDPATGLDFLCSGTTGPSTTNGLTGGWTSNTYVDGETRFAATGLHGNINSATFGVAIDSTSSITSSVAGGNLGLNDGTALFIVNTGDITSVTPYGSGINGNLSSSLAAGLRLSVTGAGSIDITQGSTSTISGATSGIISNVAGAGSTKLALEGQVLGGSGPAITATSAGGEMLLTNTNFASSFSSNNGGVYLTSGAGKLIVSTLASISGGLGTGLKITAGGDASVNLSGTTTGAEGIHVEGSNGGVLSVTSGNLTSSTGDGITVINTTAGANTGTIDVTHNAITTLNSAADGIVTDSGTSTGATKITVNGEIVAVGAGVNGTSTLGDITVNVAAAGKIDPLIGVDLNTVSGTLAVNNAGLIEGDLFGVRMQASGAGALNVNSTGTVNSSAGSAVYASSNGGAVDVAVNDVNGASSYGVLAHTTGAGTVGVTTNGSLFGGGIGIDAQAADGNVTVTTIGDVTGGVHGVYAQSSTGTVLVTGAGTVDGLTGSGVRTRNGSGQTNVNGVGAVTGAVNGISSVADSGNIAIDTGSTITGTSGSGITALTKLNGTITISNTALVTGGTNGIDATTESGNLTVDAKGSVVGGTTAINVNSNGGAINVTAADASGTASYGVFAHNKGTGTVDVTSSG
ncbi:MAG: beta strand repeat-containing protein, partial [Novosphingobium sp.]